MEWKTRTEKLWKEKNQNREQMLG